MSIALVEKEIARFLVSPEREVLCIRGKWGIGKTYAWNVFLKRAASQNAVSMKSYSYVSLFGLDSLEQVKLAIFENSISVAALDANRNVRALASNVKGLASKAENFVRSFRSQPSVPEQSRNRTSPSVSSVGHDAVAVVETSGRRLIALAQAFPQLRGYGIAFQSLAFMGLTDHIVCFDDLERKGSNLKIKDLLGLVAQLRDQKSCKAVLILNDDSLGEEKEAFDAYNEKVIDESLEFAPTAVECSQIAIIGREPVHDRLRAAVTTLGITNIRIIRKIERLIARVQPLISKLSPKVLDQAVDSLALLTWAAFARSDDVPSLEFLEKKRGTGLYGLDKDEVLTDAEQRWSGLLDRFQFRAMDKFDFELLSGVQRGYFDEAKVRDLGSELDEKIRNAASLEAFAEAWRLYHDSFANNGDQVADTVYQAARDCIQAISLSNLDGTVRLLKDLGREQQAVQLIKYFFEQRNEQKEFYDLERVPFGDQVVDPDVSEAVKVKFNSFKDIRRPEDVLRQIADRRSWSPPDTKLLSALSVENYCTMFREHLGAHATDPIRFALEIGKIENADDEMKLISQRAKEALERIGAESAINRRRVRKFGIKVQ